MTQKFKQVAVNYLIFVLKKKFISSSRTRSLSLDVKGITVFTWPYLDYLKEFLYRDVEKEVHRGKHYSLIFISINYFYLVFYSIITNHLLPLHQFVA